MGDIVSREIFNWFSRSCRVKEEVLLGFKREILLFLWWLSTMEFSLDIIEGKRECDNSADVQREVEYKQEMK